MSMARPTNIALRNANQRFYDALWMHARLVEPQRFNTWPLVSALVANSQCRLEVAPGLRPRLPVEGTHFADLSAPAVKKLRSRAASVSVATITALPFGADKFDLVCAFDIVEHVDDEDAALSELARVCMADGIVVMAVPLHPSRWTPFDDLVGHCRRYEPMRLLNKLLEHGLVVQSSAVYGMQPNSSRVVDLGMWWLTHHRERAMWLYNRVMMPLGMHFQKKLLMQSGMIDATGIDEILLVCRKDAPALDQPSDRAQAPHRLSEGTSREPPVTVATPVSHYIAD